MYNYIDIDIHGLKASHRIIYIYMYIEVCLELGMEAYAFGYRLESLGFGVWVFGCRVAGSSSELKAHVSIPS